MFKLKKSNLKNHARKVKVLKHFQDNLGRVFHKYGRLSRDYLHHHQSLPEFPVGQEVHRGLLNWIEFLVKKREIYKLQSIDLHLTDLLLLLLQHLLQYQHLLLLLTLLSSPPYPPLACLLQLFQIVSRQVEKILKEEKQ